MNLNELKIWVHGFQSALNEQNPNKQQWQVLVDMIMAAEDASTKENATPILAKPKK